MFVCSQILRVEKRGVEEPERGKHRSQHQEMREQGNTHAIGSIAFEQQKMAMACQKRQQPRGICVCECTCCLPPSELLEEAKKEAEKPRPSVELGLLCGT